jgi:Domain of unknown function (DUF4190)
VPDFLLIRCSSCSTTNRLFRDKMKPGLAPVCGHCKSPLTIIDGTTANFVIKWICGSCGCGMEEGAGRCEICGASSTSFLKRFVCDHCNVERESAACNCKDVHRARTEAEAKRGERPRGERRRRDRDDVNDGERSRRRRRDPDDLDYHERPRRRRRRETSFLIPTNQSAWAVISGYLGLLSVCALPAPLAVITGILALRDLRRNPDKGGKSRAVFGIITGIFGTIALVASFIAAVLEKK